MSKTSARARTWFLFALALAHGIATTASTLTPTVHTTNGTLVGVRNTQYEQDFFLGIPYAQPPVGKLRYRRPRPVAQTWGERRDATEYGAGCYAAPVPLPVFDQQGVSYAESEDCLTLNVVRPAGVDKADTKLPVLVWIHGGGFSEGNSADQRYNISFLVRESVDVGAPVIGVTINYRLSGFGFLPGSRLNRTGVANLGLYDQRLALGWIQDNIAAFGGDPSRVTLQGESAGAISVGHQFLAFGGRDDGLFRAGIMQSGGVGAGAPFLPEEAQDIAYNRVLNETGCTSSKDTLDCLREVPVDRLRAAFQGMEYFPSIDGDLVGEHPAVDLDAGRFVRRPILTGTNTNEGTAFTIVEDLFPQTTTDFRAAMARYLRPGTPNTTLDVIAADYLNNMSSEEAQLALGTVLPSSNPAYGALYGRATIFRGDQLFMAARRYSTETWARYGVPAYSYRFDVVPSGVDARTLGVSHFAEVPFVFHNLDGVGHDINFLASDFPAEREALVRLSGRMSRMWLSFVNELTPNSHYSLAQDVLSYLSVDTYLAAGGKGQVPRWPVYSNRSKVNMLFRKEGVSLERDDWRASAIRRLNDVDLLA